MPDGTSYTKVGSKNVSTEVISPASPAPDPINNPDADFTTVYSKLCGIAGGGEEIAPGGGTLLIYDEGNILARTVQTLNFVGLGVQATSNDDINVNITVLNQPVSQQGIQQAQNMASMNFVGGGVSVAADANGNCTVTVPEDAVLSVFGRTGAVIAENGDYVLDQIGDVVITNAATGEALVFDGAIWRNQIVSTVGSLDDLTDVTLTNIQVGDVLTYDGNEWVNAPAAAGGAQFLDDLLDVLLPGVPLDLDVLTYDTAQGQWVNQPAVRQLDDLSDVTLSGVINTQVVVYDELTAQWVNANITDITVGNEFRQVQLTEVGTATPAVFDGVKTTFEIRQWDDINDAVFVLGDYPENVIVGLEGLLQHPRLHYVVGGSQITFVTPPPADALYDMRVLWIGSVVTPVDNYVLLGNGVDRILLGDQTGGPNFLKLGSTLA